MLRIHFMQQWFGLSDPAMEEALFDVPMYREFAQLTDGLVRLPDESTILRFRHLLEKHGLAAQMFAAVNATLGAKGLMLKTGSVVDATLIAAPSSTKNSTGTRDPDMHQTKKGNNWYFGMKAHIAVDAHSGLVHHQVCTAANVHDLSVVEQLLHGKEREVFADSGYRGIEKRSRRKRVRWSIAMTPGKRKALDMSKPIDALKDKVEYVKASIRAKVEHPFRVIKRQFGYAKARYRGLTKNAAQVTTLFMLSNLWMARRNLQGSRG
jgi:IS5 family transposase